MAIRNYIYIYSIILLVALVLSCSSEEGPTQNTLRYPEAENQNIDHDELVDAYNALSALNTTKCLIVEKNGVVVVEEYFNGYTPESYIHIWSCTKSITSLLMGIALDKGHISSIEQPISDFISAIKPDLDPVKGSIPVKHFLTMTSGLPWRELSEEGFATSGNDFPSWRNSENQVNWVLNKPLLHTPGEHWNYHTGGSHLLSVIISQAVGKNLSDFANEHLFEPLNIQIGEWPEDKQGYNTGGHGLNLTGRDMLKIGRMMLGNGNYNGEQIISGAWINESTRYHYPVFNIVDNRQGYGYQWWRNTFGRMNYIYASGYGGQTIIFIPTKNTIIVTGSRAEESNTHEALHTTDLIWQAIIGHLLPAIN